MTRILFIAKCFLKMPWLAIQYAWTYLSDAGVLVWAVWDFFKFSFLGLVDYAAAYISKMKKANGN
ncbi:MAG: hypothetical protein PHG00_09465 [Methylococcales bacterium]|nr:hypothetical protein [Methylococcales bacterium]